MLAFFLHLTYTEHGQVMIVRQSEEKKYIYLMQAIYRVNRTTELDEFRYVCFEQLRIGISFTKGVFYLAQRKNGQIIHFSPLGFGFDNAYDSERNFQAFAQGQYGNSWAELQFSPWSCVRLNSEIHDMEVFERSKTYRDLYQPANIHHALQMVLIHDDTLLGIVALFRPRTEPDFSLADVKLLETLKEHLALKLWQLTAARQTASPQGQDASLADLFLLTTRELEIVQLVKLGLDNFQICQKLCISKSTLHKHFFNIYRKMNVSNRMQLYRYLVSQKK